MIDIVNDFNLTQMVTEPTLQGNILDLLFTSHSNLVDKVYTAPGMSDHDDVICDINLRANPPANPERNVYLYKGADMEGLRRKLKELALSYSKHPILKQSLFEHIRISLKQTFRIPLTSVYHRGHSKTKDLFHDVMQTLRVSSVKSSDAITLYVATERNKVGVDLGISVSWYIKNRS